MQNLIVRDIPILHIAPYKDRDRDPERFAMLIKSMDSHGLLEPISVAPNTRGSKKYILIAGHGRLRAAKKLRWQKIPGVLREQHSLTEFLVENWRRELSWYEQAVLVELDFRMGLDKKKIAEKFSVQVPTIMQYVSIVRNLDPELGKLVKAKKMTKSDAARVAARLPMRAQSTLVQSIKQGESYEPSSREVKRAVDDVMGAVRHRGSLDNVSSVQKLHSVRKETKQEGLDTREALGIVRSHWLRSVGELRGLLKAKKYRALFDKHGIDYSKL